MVKLSMARFRPVKFRSRDQSFQDNYRKWVELRSKSSGTPDIKYRVSPRYGTCCEAGYTKADFHGVAKCEDCSIPICEDCADESIHRLNDFIICQVCRTRRNVIQQQLNAGEVVVSGPECPDHDCTAALAEDSRAHCHVSREWDEAP